MLKALPFLWFLLAALGAAAQLYVMSLAGADAGTALLSTASSLLITTVAAIGMALVYLLILRARPSLAVAIIGYSHLFLASAAQVGQAVGNLERNRYLAGEGATDYSTMSFAYTAAGLATLLGGIVFILALIVALNTRDEAPEDVF